MIKWIVFVLLVIEISWSNGFPASRRSSQTTTLAKSRRIRPVAVQLPATSPNAASQIEENSTSNHATTVTPRYFAVKALLPRRRGRSTKFAVDRLETSRNYDQFSVRDRSFCRLLVTTAERRLGQIDAVLAACQTKKKKPQQQQSKQLRIDDQWVQAVLRIGAVQLLFLQTPAHAAVKETIDVLRFAAVNDDDKIRISEPKIKYANAILRRLSREGPHLLATVPGATVSANAAPWLVTELEQTWGEQATERILSAAMVETPRCLTVNLKVAASHFATNTNSTDESRNKDSGSDADIIENLAGLFRGAEILPQGSIRVDKPPPGPISKWPLYKEGLWWCQDPAATVPAMALYQAVSGGGKIPVDNMHVIDLCAAPGGKTAQLDNYGFGTVTAVEISARRSDRLVHNMERLRMHWNVVVADGCEWSPPPQEEPVDAVLVDVPCTATGTASKRPDVLRRDSDFQDLLDVQYQLACHAADTMVRVGGVLVYATCSLLKQESEEQVERLLRRQGGALLDMEPFQPGEIPGFDDAIDHNNGWMRILPGALPGCLGQCDGFFVARLRRIS